MGYKHDSDSKDSTDGQFPFEAHCKTDHSLDWYQHNQYVAYNVEHTRINQQNREIETATWDFLVPSLWDRIAHENFDECCSEVKQDDDGVEALDCPPQRGISRGDQKSEIHEEYGDLDAQYKRAIYDGVDPEILYSLVKDKARSTDSLHVKSCDSPKVVAPKYECHRHC